MKSKREVFLILFHFPNSWCMLWLPVGDGACIPVETGHAPSLQRTEIPKIPIGCDGGQSSCRDAPAGRLYGETNGIYVRLYAQIRISARGGSAQGHRGSGFGSPRGDRAADAPRYVLSPCSFSDTLEGFFVGFLVHEAFFSVALRPSCILRVLYLVAVFHRADPPLPFWSVRRHTFIVNM